MNRSAITFLVILLPFLAIAQAEKESARITSLFNFGWKFQAGTITDAQAVAFDDSKWRALDLPHDFQMEQPWDKSAGGARGFKTMGEGWYRKSFKVDPAWKAKRVLLDFEGIMLTGEVWVNGKKIGSADYGYLGFEADISKLVNFEGENIVAVRASTGKAGSSRWYTGGGIFRDVHLVVKDTIAIARHGVYITTPTVSEQQAAIRVQVELEGLRGRRLPVEINTRIFSPDGRLVAEAKQLAPQNANLRKVEAPLPDITIREPQLWSCETPHLYTASVSLVYNGKVIDEVTQPFGIRTLAFSNQYGFKLNGKKVFLKGIANHHDLGVVGAAVYDFAIERLFKQLKAFGYNHVRTSHNPYSESFLRLADKYGILIVDELCDKWSEDRYWPGAAPFSQQWYKIVPEWIKRDRNHPSVILWSLGNELQMAEDLAGFPTSDWGVTTYRILDVLVKRYDSTRKTTVAMFPARANAVGKTDPEFDIKVYPPELATVTEIASFNYRYHNYAQYLQHAPHMIMYQSEATTKDKTAPFYGMDREKMVGLAYWGAIEYWGESTGWPNKGWTYSFFNHALQPYPEAWLVKAAFSDEPLVHIAVVDGKSESMEWNDITVGSTRLSSHWNRQPNTQQTVFTYTNADEVELLVNGKPYGVQKNNRDSIRSRNIIAWQNVPYGNGGNIAAIARTNGKEVARHQLETTGKPVALKMELENTAWKANGMDLQYVKVFAVDNKGRVVPAAPGEVVFEVSGGAQLIAVDNGDHASGDLFAGNTKTLHYGFAMAILRSNQTPGTVTIKASVKGLKAVEKKEVTK